MSRVIICIILLALALFTFLYKDRQEGDDGKIHYSSNGLVATLRIQHIEEWFFDKSKTNLFGDEYVQIVILQKNENELHVIEIEVLSDGYNPTPIPVKKRWVNHGPIRTYGLTSEVKFEKMMYLPKFHKANRPFFLMRKGSEGPWSIWHPTSAELDKKTNTIHLPEVKKLPLAPDNATYRKIYKYLE